MQLGSKENKEPLQQFDKKNVSLGTVWNLWKKKPKSDMGSGCLNTGIKHWLWCPGVFLTWQLSATKEEISFPPVLTHTCTLHADVPYPGASHALEVCLHESLTFAGKCLFMVHDDWSSKLTTYKARKPFSFSFLKPWGRQKFLYYSQCIRSTSGTECIT